jgi:hypothetical protein
METDMIARRIYTLRDSKKDLLDTALVVAGPPYTARAPANKDVKIAVVER